jgi:hypothetical protein
MHAINHSEAVIDRKPTEKATKSLKNKPIGLGSQTPKQLHRTKSKQITSDTDPKPEKEVNQQNTAAEESQGERKIQIRSLWGGAESCYRLEKENCGFLARAVCRNTRKKCWIQAFERKRNESDEETGQQLQQVRSLDHPNILKVLELFQDEAHFYAVYEATEGDSAEELCARTGGVSEQWTAAIMRQVFAALSHCHSKGVLLKTLSAKHVLFTETPIQEHTSVKLLIPIGEEEDSYLAPELKSRAYIVLPMTCGAAEC